MTPQWNRNLHRCRAALALAVLAGTLSTLPAVAAPGLPHGVSAVRSVEGIDEYRLDNGLQVLLIADASKPTITVSTTYRVGSRMESYGETGMAHLLEHLTFKGTKNIANVGQELSKRGIGFNGNTSYDRTVYFENFPADPATLDWVLGVEAERMTAANVARSDLDTEMTVVRNEMEAGENNSLHILTQKMLAAAFQWHNYGKSVIGARSDVENVDIPRLQAFYRRYYQPDNATLIVAGKFETAAVLGTIAARFGSLAKPTRVLSPTYTAEPVQEGERQVTLRRSGGEQYVALAYHIPGSAAADAAAFNVIATALGDTPNGRLQKRLLDTHIANDVFAYPQDMVEAGVMLLGARVPADGDLARAQQALLGIAESLDQQPITADELKRAKLQQANGYQRLFDNPQQLALALSDAIAAGDWRLLLLARDDMQKLQLADVNRVAQVWFTASNRTLGLFIPTDKAVRAPAVVRGDVAARLQDFKPREGSGGGEDFAATPQNIEARTERVTLPSGLTLLLLPKKTRGATVLLNMLLRFGDENSLRGQRSAAELVADMLERGSSKRSRQQLADAQDALQTHIRLHGWISGATVGLTTRREHLAESLDLLAEMLRQPAFPAQEFGELRQEVIGSLQSNAKQPQNVAGVTLERYLHPYPHDDPRYNTSHAEHIEELQALQLDQLKQFYQRFWGMDHAEIALVGDFDPVAVKTQLAALFGDWKSGMPYQRVPNLLSQAAPQVLLNQVPDKQNAAATGALTLALHDSDADYPALLLATHVLGSGFDSRLSKRIRQKEGLSYGAGASLNASGYAEKIGQIGLNAIYAPQNREKLQAAFADELQRFARDGITAEELADGKRAIATQRATSYASDGNEAGLLLQRAAQQRTLAFDIALQAQIDALELTQVNAAIKRWINPDNVVWSLAGNFDGTAGDCRPPAACAPAAPAPLPSPASP